MVLAKDVRPEPMENGSIRLRVIWRRSRQSAVDQLATDMQPAVVLIRDHRRLIGLLSLRILAFGQAADQLRIICSEVVKFVGDSLAGVRRVRGKHGHIEVATCSFGELRDVLLRAGPHV